jgi:hypothetical protein
MDRTDSTLNETKRARKKKRSQPKGYSYNSDKQQVHLETLFDWEK